MQIKSFWVILLCAITLNFSTSLAKPGSSFDEKMKQNSFKIDVSNKNLSKMHEASTLLISCVDFRLRDETERLMSEQLGLLDDYDEVAMPGAALALVEAIHPHWKQTAEDIVGILEKLHHIKRIILLDHRECGAFKLVKGHDHTKSAELETAEHKKVMSEAKASLQKQFPHIKVYTMLMGLDGTVENFNE